MSNNDALVPVEVEAKLIGALLQDAEAMDVAREHNVSTASFGDPILAAVYQTMTQQYNVTGNFNYGTILDAAVGSEFFKTYDDATNLVRSILDQSLDNSSPYHVATYCEAVIGYAKRRYSRKQGHKIIAAAEDVNTPLADSMQKIETDLLKATASTLRPARGASVSTAARLMWRYNNPAQVRGMRTGFTKLDNLTHGLGDSNLMVLFGFSSAGKSTLMQQWLLNFCNQVEEGQTIAVVPTEMTVEQWKDRLVAFMMGVSTDVLNTGFLDALPQFRNEEPGYAGYLLEETANKVDSLPITWIEINGRKPNGMDLLTRGRTGKHQLMIVDGLADLGAVKPEFEQDEFKTVTANMNCLHLLFQQYGMNVLFTHQLKQPDTATLPKPTPAHLRGSGRIFHLVDGCFSIYRPEQADGLSGEATEARNNKAVLHCYKWRGAPIEGKEVNLIQIKALGKQGFIEGDIS